MSAGSGGGVPGAPPPPRPPGQGPPPGAPQPHPSAPRDRPGGPQDYPGTPQDYPGTPQGYPGGPQDYPPRPSGPQVAGGHATASGHAAVAGAFEPPAGMAWSRVSHRLVWYRRVQVLAGSLGAMIVGALLAGNAIGWIGGLVVMLGVLGCAVVAWGLAEYNARSWGYTEQPGELLLTHGVLVRRFLMVPYGRMQLVDVNSNVVQQWFGIATVRMYTAAATTDARIPGLPQQEAEQLRARLAAKNEARSMGL